MYKTLREFLKNCEPTINALFEDGALRNPNRFPLYGRIVEGAVLFADLPGYSRIGESSSPEVCAYVINHFFAWMEEEGIKRYGGIIDKFIGDEVMVVFSREFHNNDPIEAALNTAKSMILGDHWTFEPKIGIASGKFLICCIGSEQRFDVSVVGHTVNLAARCVSSLQGGKSIKVATQDAAIINKIFSEHDDWKIIGPQLESFKNMSPIQVVQINCKFVSILNFDYLSNVRQTINSILNPKRSE